MCNKQVFASHVDFLCSFEGQGCTEYVHQMDYSHSHPDTDSMMLVIGLLSSKQAFKGHASSDKLTAEDP